MTKISCIPDHNGRYPVQDINGVMRGTHNHSLIKFLRDHTFYDINDVCIANVNNTIMSSDYMDYKTAQDMKWFDLPKNKPYVDEEVVWITLILANAGISKSFEEVEKDYRGLWNTILNNPVFRDAHKEGEDHMIADEYRNWWLDFSNDKNFTTIRICGNFMDVYCPKEVHEIELKYVKGN